jgi:hypothetical protein
MEIAENASGDARETRPNATGVDEKLSLTRDVNGAQKSNEMCGRSELSSQSDAVNDAQGEF